VSDVTDDIGMTVEELSARTGTPVRTIREYQTWRVLPPPTRVGRRGFYDDSHVRRLEGIARLQRRGYSIAAMRDLFAAWETGAGLPDVLGVEDALGAPADEAPLVLSHDDLRALVPAIAGSPRLLRRACQVGLLVGYGDDLAARSPALLQLVADAVWSGLSPTAALDVAEAVVRAADEAGEAAAGAVAQIVAGRPPSGASLRRGRVLLARAIATHTIDRAGHHLLRRAAAQPLLADLVADTRIGTVVQAPRGGAGQRAT
jgi:DNA-binding transcriptional MerR regulator